MYQKQRIKKDYERKRQQEELDKKTDESLSQQKQDEKATTVTTKTDGNTATKFFPKVVHKDLLREAAEANRNYIIKQTEKLNRKARKKSKKLSQNLLQQIRVEIFNNNKLNWNSQFFCSSNSMLSIFDFQYFSSINNHILII